MNLLNLSSKTVKRLVSLDVLCFTNSFFFSSSCRLFHSSRFVGRRCFVVLSEQIVTAVFVTFKLPFHNVFMIARSAYLLYKSIPLLLFPSLRICFVVVTLFSFASGAHHKNNGVCLSLYNGETNEADERMARHEREDGKITGKTEVRRRHSLALFTACIRLMRAMLMESILPVHQVEMIEMLTFNAAII